MRLSIFSTLALTAILSSAASAQTAGAYKVTNILSDGSVPAAATDANFIDPWAISSSGTWWISTAGSGMNFVIPATGIVNFRVVVPNASGSATATGSPAGSVTTGGSPATAFILPNGTKASFLFSTLDGTIAGWNSKLGTAGAISTTVINNAGASYPGLALLNNTSASYLLAPNFNSGKVEIYGSDLKPATLPSTFTDPALPANYTPFAVHIIGTQVFVAYALRTPAAPFRRVNATGNGIVSVFDTNGNYVARIATGGNLNSPWGVAIAPANFGIFSKSILIGNFGDGLINAYDPKTFVFQGQLTDGSGKPLAYAALWELLPGGTTVTGTTGVSGGDTSTVYFTAGLTGEAHGLFAAISNDTSAGTPSFGLSTSNPVITLAAGGSALTTVNLAPTFGFSGSATFTCSGLPVGAACTFSPASVPVTPTTSASGILTISTNKAVALNHSTGLSGVVAALLFLPFASIAAFARRRPLAPSLRLLCATFALASAATFIIGCADNSVAAPPATPAGQSTVVVTATSGSTTQKTSITLNVQ